jgi:peptide/nickel transport system permease protein
VSGTSAEHFAQSVEVDRPLWVAERSRVREVWLVSTLGAVVRNRLGAVGLIVIVALIIVAGAAPVLAPADPLVMDKVNQFAPPSPGHLFGTDEFGRDILSRVIYGARISLTTGAVAILIATTIGVPVGVVAGYVGGRTDVVIMRLLDCLLAFPAILLAMAVVAVLGPNSLDAIIAVGIVSIPAFLRLARASALSQREKEYVEAARAIGAPGHYIVFRTILPNCFAPLIVQMAIAGAQAILLEAALSFLGLGTTPPDPSWGAMLNTGRSFLHQAPWYAVFPGLTLTILILALNLFSDALQQALDPRASGRGSDRVA